MFDAVKKSFDEIALFVKVMVVFARAKAVGARGYDGLRSDAIHFIYNRISVISFVRQNGVRAKTIQQRLCLRGIIAFSSRQNKTQRVTQRVHQCVNFGGKSSFGTA